MDRVPILSLRDVLLVSIQVDLEDQLAVRLQEDLAERIVATSAHGVIIDITALDIVDSFVGRTLATIASVSRVLDADTVVVGMRPAVATKLSLVDQTKLVTAASELARNTLIHGGGGHARVEPVTNGRRNGLRLVFTDQGPGIEDVDRAFADGYSTGGGLGLGLSGARRLMDEFELVTTIGQGTRVAAVKWER